MKTFNKIIRTKFIDNFICDHCNRDQIELALKLSKKENQKICYDCAFRIEKTEQILERGY